MGNKILVVFLVVAMVATFAGCRKNTVEEPMDMTEPVTETVPVATEETIPEETKTEGLSFFEGDELEEATGEPEETVSGTEATEPMEGETEGATETEKESEAKPDDSNSGNDSDDVEGGDMLEPPLNDSSVELG